MRGIVILVVPVDAKASAVTTRESLQATFAWGDRLEGGAMGDRPLMRGMCFRVCDMWT